MRVTGGLEESGGRPEVLEVRQSAKGCGGWAAGSFPRGNPTADHLECAGKWGGNEAAQVARRRWARGGVAILLHARVCWKVERTGFEKRD